MRVHIDRACCTGTGSCVRQAPRMLELVREGVEIHARVLPDGQATERELRAAAESCPWAAVILEDDDGKILYP